MHILLINQNPVVSRLLALCTRDENMVLEEVADIDTIEDKHYDVVCIDAASYHDELMHFLELLSIGKKVLLSNDEMQMHGFDLKIKKPFLPSQIIEIFEKIEVSDNSVDTEKKAVSIFPLAAEVEEVNTLDTQVLDADELEKIKSLLDMNERIEASQEALSEEEIEERKVALIKAQLIADGLEIVEEKEIVDVLNREDEVCLFSSPEDQSVSVKKHKKTKSSKKKDKKAKKRSKKYLDFSETERKQIENVVEGTISKLKRKQIKKLLKGKEIEISIKLEDKK